jgi:hypothetical protein
MFSQFSAVIFLISKYYLSSPLSIVKIFRYNWIMPPRRTQPPRPPAGPPASPKDGAAAVIKAAVKLFDRQDGNGVEKRLLAEILFLAAFETLDQVEQEDRRKMLAGRVHIGAYNRPRILLI